MKVGRGSLVVLKPQTTRPTVILAFHTESLKSYLENPYLVLEIERPCPVCMTRSLSRHGHVERWAYEAGEVRHLLRVFRMRCRPCGLTVTLLPDFLLPFTRYVATVVEAAATLYLTGAGSCRAVALAITGTAVSDEVLRLSSLTDAVEDLALKPSFQRIHAWVARLAEQAVTDVQAAAAWATTRVPTSTVVDHQTVPLDPPAVGPTRNAAKRAGLDAARMLVRIFAAVPELNPARTGWLAAWLRFVAVVRRRTPWRGPPRSPPEPRSS